MECKFLWNMEDARMEWKISRMEWKTIFHTRFRLRYSEKNIYGHWTVINHILTEEFNICSIICRQIQIVWLHVLCQQCTAYALHYSKNTAICSIDVVVDSFDRLDLYFSFRD